MPLVKKGIKNVIVWVIFAAFLIIMLVIMHPAWWGS